MIGRIAGIILHRGLDHVLIDVRGVGYIVHVDMRTAAALPPAGQAVALYTDLLVREDLLQLTGFRTLLEKEWHRLLMTVQGVGSKASLSILGTLGADGVARAVAIGDWASLKAAPGVGPKLAQRLAMELKGRAPSVVAMGGDLTVDLPELIEGEAPLVASKAPAARASAPAEALSALTNLGYSQAEAAQAVAEASTGETETPALIRAALKRLAPKS